MADLTDYFIDPTVASDGGLGTLASPWTRADGNCYQYAIDNITRSPNGDRVNIKAGTPHTSRPAVNLDYTTFGTLSAQAPLVWQGYTSAVGDGGLGEWLDYGNEGVQQYHHIFDCKFVNCSFELRGRPVAIGCVFDVGTCSHDDQVLAINSAGGCIAGNYFYADTDNTTVRYLCKWDGADRFALNVFDMGLMNHSLDAWALNAGSASSPRCVYNLFKCGAQPATADLEIMELGTQGHVIWKNTFDGNGRIAYGIVNESGNTAGNEIFENVFFGFSGAGASAYYGRNTGPATIMANTFYDNTADISDDGSAGPIYEPLANSTATGALAADAANDDYTLQTDQGGDVETTLAHPDQPTTLDDWRGAFPPAAPTEVGTGSPVVTATTGNI